MDISHTDNISIIDKSGKREKVSKGNTDCNICASFYFHNDFMRYAPDFSFTLRRSDKCYCTGAGSAGSGELHRFGICIPDSIWQDAGWGTIIYLATLSSVDASLHEAAKVDGASTWQRILHIDIPELVPIIVIQLIMQFGNLMNVGFEKAFLLQTNLNKETSEIIATYVYEQGMLKAMYSFSTAVGLFNTAVNIILLIAVNKICKKLSDVSFI